MTTVPIDVHQDRDLLRMHAHLDQEPGDWATRLILADKYEELGDLDHARLHRWLVQKRKHVVWSEGVKGWVAWGAEGGKPTHFGELAHARNIGRAYYMDGGFPTRQEAEEAILRYLLTMDFQVTVPDTDPVQEES